MNDIQTLRYGDRITVSYYARGLQFGDQVVPLMGYSRIVTADSPDLRVIAQYKGILRHIDKTSLVIALMDKRDVAILRDSIIQIDLRP